MEDGSSFQEPRGKPLSSPVPPPAHVTDITWDQNKRSHQLSAHEALKGIVLKCAASRGPWPSGASLIQSHLSRQSESRICPKVSSVPGPKAPASRPRGVLPGPRLLPASAEAERPGVAGGDIGAGNHEREA